MFAYVLRCYDKTTSNSIFIFTKPDVSFVSALGGKKEQFPAKRIDHTKLCVRAPARRRQREAAAAVAAGSRRSPRKAGFSGSMNAVQTRARGPVVRSVAKHCHRPTLVCATSVSQ